MEAFGRSENAVTRGYTYLLVHTNFVPTVSNDKAVNTLIIVNMPWSISGIGKSL